MNDATLDDPQDKMLPESADSGPFVVLAALLERVELRTDGTLGVAQGFISGIAVPPPFHDDLRANLVLTVMFNAGGTHASRALMVWGRLPSGKRELVASGIVSFLGQGTYATSITDISIPVGQPGIIWFDVELAGHRVSRFAIHVRHESVPDQAANG